MANFKPNKLKLTYGLLIIVIVSITVMRIFDAPLKNDICKNGIVSYELAKDINISKNILNSWDTNAKINAGLNLGFDFLFLILYSSLIALLIYNVNHRLWKNTSLYKLGKFMVFLIFTAALFDIIENAALITLLRGNLNQLWSSIAYFSAIIKFSLIVICILYLLFNWILLFFKPKKAI